MIEPASAHTDPLEWEGGVARFRGRVVECRDISAGGFPLRIASLRDAAELLDDTDFARRFIEEDVAPYGVELWPAAKMLAEWVAGESPPEGGTAIELGCGVGLVSIAASRMGWRVTASDYESTALAFASYNARINHATIEEWLTLDWRDPPGDRRFDRVLGADLLYQLVDHGPIADCIDRLLAPEGVALIADPNRGVADRFAEIVERRGLAIETHGVALAEGGKSPRKGRIFRIYRP